MKLVMGTMLGLAFALVAAAAITPILKDRTRWSLLLVYGGLTSSNRLSLRLAP